MGYTTAVCSEITLWFVLRAVIRAVLAAFLSCQPVCCLHFIFCVFYGQIKNEWMNEWMNQRTRKCCGGCVCVCVCVVMFQVSRWRVLCVWSSSWCLKPVCQHCRATSTLRRSSASSIEHASQLPQPPPRAVSTANVGRAVRASCRRRQSASTGSQQHHQQPNVGSVISTPRS